MVYPAQSDGPGALSISEELKLIPRWSVAAAAAAFVGMQYIFWFLLPEHRHHPGPPIGLRIYFALSWSTLAALYLLMVGYVSRDAPRRGMRSRLWIVVCLLLPGGIGAVLYFLLRQPLLALCPSCGGKVQADYHFCPQCAYQVSASCGNCYASVRPSDLFCVDCGHDLATANMPARLHAFRS